MKNKKEKVNIKTIWKIFRSEKGKKYSFIIFYIFFFIFLFIMLSFPNNNTSLKNETTSNDSLPYKTKNLEDKSYKFTYIIKHDLDLAEYSGEKDNSSIVLKDDRGVYNFIYQNGNLINLENYNIPYQKLLDIFEIKKIVKNSKLISETKMTDDNLYIYNYTISNEELSNLFNDTKNGNLNAINWITITTNSNKEIKEIKFDLTNYQLLTDNQINSYEITITYGDTYE